jgi:eukaryotic-like serine/threonine-protein kinase
MANDDGAVEGLDREQQVCEVLAAYFESVEAGQDPDRARWLARYPDYADQIGRFFDDQDRLLKFTEPIRPIADAPTSDDSAFDPAQVFRKLTAGFNADLRPAAYGALATVRSIGDYELIDEIARGGMGIVFLARHRSLNRRVALKMLRADALATEADQERFLREAQAAAKLDHPNIVPIFEVGQHEGHNYFSMKLVEGNSLARRLPDFASDQRAAAKLMATVARAVRHAHERGILHRDLKPSNILVDDQGQPHVSDFGLAKWVEDDSELTQSGAILGTPSYMAPEQALGKKGGATTATDVYGLGAILYTLLTGRPPFQADSVLETIEDVKGREPDPPSTVNWRVDRDLETICLKCLEKEPARRYRSAQDVADELERWLRGEPIKARRVGPLEQTWRWCRRNPKPSALLTAMTVLAVCAVVGFLLALNARNAVAKVNRELLMHDRLTRRKLFLADIQRASDLMKSNKITKARKLLARHRPLAGAVDERGFEWYYLWRLCNLGRQTLRGHDGDVYHAEFSPDGQVLATCSRDRTIRLWEVASGKTRLVLTGHSNEVNYVTFAPDGLSLASASEDETVNIWDPATGRIRHTLSAHRNEVVSVLYTRDGCRLVSCDRGGQVILWDPATGRQQLSFDVSDKWVEAMAISGDGTTLAVGGNGVGLWDLATGRKKLILDESNSSCKCVMFNHTGRLVTTNGNGIRCWDAQIGKRVGGLGELGPTLFSVCQHPDPRWMAWADAQGIVGFWDAPTGYAGKILTGQGRVWCVTFAPDGRTLATASRDGTVKLWDFARDRDRYVIPVPSPKVNSIAFSPDGQTLFGAGGDGTVWSWEMPEGKVLSKRQFAFSGKLVDAKLSRSATTVALVESNKTCRVWDVKTGRRIFTVENDTPLDYFHVYHDGNWLSAREFNEPNKQPTSDRIVVSNTAIGHALLLSGPDYHSIGYLALCADRDYLAWGVPGGLPRFLDLATGRTSDANGRGHIGEIQALEFSPNGKTLATIGEDRTIKLWDVDTFEERLDLRPLQGDGSALAFSPDGQTLAFYAGGHSLTLGDLRTGEIGINLGTFDSLTSMTFSPEGSALATSVSSGASSDWSVIYAWPAPRTD